MFEALIDQSYVALWFKGENGEPDQYGAYARNSIRKGDIVMQCLIPFDHLPKDTEEITEWFANYRLQTDYGYIMPLGNILVMNMGKGDSLNCAVNVPKNSNARIIEVIALRNIEQDEELRWSYSA